MLGEWRGPGIPGVARVTIEDLESRAMTGDIGGGAGVNHELAILGVECADICGTKLWLVDKVADYEEAVGYRHLRATWMLRIGIVGVAELRRDRGHKRGHQGKQDHCGSGND